MFQRMCNVQEPLETVIAVFAKSGGVVDIRWIGGFKEVSVTLKSLDVFTIDTIAEHAGSDGIKGHIAVPWPNADVWFRRVGQRYDG